MEAITTEDPRVGAVQYILDELQAALDRARAHLAEADDSAVPAEELEEGMSVRLPGDTFPQTVTSAEHLPDGDVLLRTNASVRLYAPRQMVQVLR